MVRAAAKVLNLLVPSLLTPTGSRPTVQPDSWQVVLGKKGASWINQLTTVYKGHPSCLHTLAWSSVRKHQVSIENLQICKEKSQGWRLQLLRTPRLQQPPLSHKSRDCKSEIKLFVRELVFKALLGVSSHGLPSRGVLLKLLHLTKHTSHTGLGPIQMTSL